MALRVPTAQPRTRPSGQGLGYFEATPVDYSGIRRGTANLAGGIQEYVDAQREIDARAKYEAERQAEIDQNERDRETERTTAIADKAEGSIQRFDTLSKFNVYQTAVAEDWAEAQKTYSPTDPEWAMKTYGQLDKRRAEFLGQVPRELQDEFDLRTQEVRQGVQSNLGEFTRKAQAAYFKNGIDKQFETMKTQFKLEPTDTNYAVAVDQFEEVVDAANIPQIMKDELKNQGRAELQAISGQAKAVQKKYAKNAGYAAVEDIPGIVAVGNIDLNNRPIVRNEDGSISTVKSIGVEIDGKEVLLPTISDDGKVLTTDEAVELYKRTGKHLGIFENKETANNYSKKLHEQQNRAYGGNAGAIREAAAELGVSALDLATVISYETGGTFSTSIKGGKGGRYLGLIQFGEEERQKFGASAGQTLPEQLKAVVGFLKARGFKPGMSILDLYSTINAGTPGRYGASDGNNTVRGHVETMQGQHRKAAEEFLGGGGVEENPWYTDPMYENLTLEQKLAIDSDASTIADKMFTEQQKQLHEVEQAFNNNLKVGLYTGDKGMQDILDAQKQGYLSKYEDLKSAIDIYEKTSADAQNAQRFVNQVIGKVPFDETNADDKKNLNAWFGDAGIQELGVGNQKYVNDVLGPMVRQIHAFPSEAVGALESMARSNDPKKQAFALDTLKQFEDWEPAAYNRVDQQTRSDVQLWRSMKGRVPDEDLFNEIRGGATAEQRQSKEMLRKEADKIFNDPQHEDFMSMEKILEVFNPSGPTGAPQPENIAWASRGALADYQTIFKYEYTRYGGNSALAKQSALKQIQARWAVSSIGGQDTLMRHPPEQVIPKSLGTVDWADRQAREENGWGPDTKFQLISDGTTENELAMGKNPSWLLTYLGADGVWREVTKNGVVQRQSFVMTPEVKKLNELQQERNELYTNLTTFNRGSVNIVDAPDAERKAAIDQRHRMTVRLQEIDQILKASKGAVSRAEGTSDQPETIPSEVDAGYRMP